MSYAAKFMVKKGRLQQRDYAVMPLEGLWWADDISAFITGDRASWKRTMMIMQPSFIDDELIETAVLETRKKKKLPGIDELRLEEFAEDRCAQILHVGPFSEEGPTIECPHEFIHARSGLIGKHHEIYLTDVRCAADVWDR